MSVDVPMPAVSFSLARILGSWGGWRRTDQTSLSRRHRHLSHFQHEASQRACAIPPSPTLTMIRRLVNLLAVLLCLLVAPNQIVEAKKQRNAPHEHKVSRPSVLMPSRLMTCWPSVPLACMQEFSNPCLVYHSYSTFFQIRRAS